jgi:hypothetical protein
VQVLPMENQNFIARSGMMELSLDATARSRARTRNGICPSVRSQLTRMRDDPAAWQVGQHRWIGLGAAQVQSPQVHQSG